MDVVCERCKQRVDDADAERRLAQCEACGLVFDVSAQAAEQRARAHERPLALAREPERLPEGFEVDLEAIVPRGEARGGYREPAAVRTSRARARARIVWRRHAGSDAQRAVLAVVTLGIMAAVVAFIGPSSGHVLLVALTAVGAVVVTYVVAALTLNRTSITVGDGLLRITEGPVPLRRPVTVLLDDIEQLWCSAKVERVTKGPRGGSELAATYALVAQLSGGREVELLRTYGGPTPLLYLEQVLEHAIGIVDVEVPGGLRRG